MKRDPLTTLSSLGRRAASGVNLSSLNSSAPRRRLFNRQRTARIGSLFRSEHMVLLRLYFDRAAAFDTIDELGELGLCEFRDLNHNQSAFQRTFSANVRRCDDMLRVVRFLHDQVVTEGSFKLAPSMYQGPDANADLRLDDLDSHLRSLEQSLLEMNANADALTTQYNEIVELRHVLEKSSDFFRAAPAAQNISSGVGGKTPSIGGSSDSKAPFVSGLFDGISALSQPSSIVVSEGCYHSDINDEQRIQDSSSKEPFDMNQKYSQRSAESADGVRGFSTLLSFFTGVIDQEKIGPFERVLFRATHGNCIVRFADLKESLVDPATREKIRKSVFMVFFSGLAVRNKVAKICDAFDANRYAIPEDHSSQMAACEQCHSRLQDLDTIISNTKAQSAEILREVANNLLTWREKVRRDMGVFHTLNLLNYDTSQKLFLAEVWCPESAQDDLRNALEIGRRRSNAQLPSILEERPLSHDDIPPTYYKTNKFTEVFQSIVESYGIARYQEVNPAPYTVVTFPFLFAVMFGDIGHGFLMAAFALYLILNEIRLKASLRRLNEFWQTCFEGRYLMFLMGFFSIFTGFIYNEFFAIPIDVFGTRWKFTTASSMACGIDNCKEPAKVLPPLEPYPFGFDPAWKGSQTGLVFFNSYKMKLSIVLGVLQMLMGLVLSYGNAKYFKESLDIYHGFIPQMVFMTSIFGYLVFLIIRKWSINYNAPGTILVPPDLKGVLIGMFMSPGKFDSSMRLFPGQHGVQKFLLLCAVVSVPWMLLPKPLILRAEQKKRKSYRVVRNDSDNEDDSSPLLDSDSSERREAFSFSEVFVNQLIHTIEFVLGAISNTASYLRLWALSLAHAELSDVFLERLLYRAIATANPVVMIIGLFMWMSLTLGVLMFMEGLSAFLHALRLHWVEFQNKFYLQRGDGRKFQPFVHSKTDDDADMVQ